MNCRVYIHTSILPFIHTLLPQRHLYTAGAGAGPSTGAAAAGAAGAGTAAIWGQKATIPGAPGKATMPAGAGAAAAGGGASPGGAA